MTIAFLTTPVGLLSVAAEDGAITSVSWTSEAPQERTDAGNGDALLEEACDQLRAYFEGRLTRFTLPLAPAGTAFRQRVWALMSEIPFGQTLTYGAMAKALGSAPRAVGGACGANPLPIIIPCHRVVGGAGPGGYSGADGLPTKHWLLAHEGVTLA